MAHRILVMNGASPGLVYPTLALVAELVARGHEVSYLTSPQFAEAVRGSGARVLPYRSRTAEVDPAEVFGDAGDGARPHLLFLAENVALLRAAVDHYHGQALPDLVLYEDFPFIAGQLLAGRWRRPAVRLSAGFASNRRYSFAQDMIEASGLPGPLTLASFRTRLAELLAEYEVGRSVEGCWHHIERLNLVFIPRAFQVAADSFDARFAFVGPCLGERRFLGGWRPPEHGPPVVLVSLGTTFNEHPRFFRECLRAFAGIPWHVVLTVGDRVDPDRLGPVPANVELHRQVSHLAVLEHARLCVTHGGMGTVMEALSWGRPIVAVPHSFDVLPMARRLAELGLGRMLPVGEVTGGRLRTAVREVVADPGTLHRVRAMQHEIRQAGGAVRAADEIEAYVERGS